jgi:hypothetical protein
MKILGRTYTLRYVKHLSESGLLGQHCGGAHEILIEEGMDADNITSTFFHEVVEAINCILELDLEHKTISAIEAGLASVFLDAKVDMSLLLKQEETKK